MASPDFSKSTVQTLAKRAAQLCSNPMCRKPTSGPHSDAAVSVVLGQAAHIRGARPKAARFDASMTDDERSAADNGIWLCNVCARRIDLDPAKFPTDLLVQWRSEHEAWVAKGCPRETPAAREITVVDGGVGGVIVNQGPGTGVLVDAPAGQIGEKIRVEGRGTGEIVTNTGTGIGKVVRSRGATASEVHVVSDGDARMVVGLLSMVVAMVCPHCQRQFHATKVVQGFAGDQEPHAKVACPDCGHVCLV